MTVVKHSIVDNIALIEISNPPVNAISAAVRIELLQVIEILALDNSLKAIVITAPERTFLAGADIKEFGKNIDAPILSEICDKIENLDKKQYSSFHTLGDVVNQSNDIQIPNNFIVTNTKLLKKPITKNITNITLFL